MRQAPDAEICHLIQCNGGGSGAEIVVEFVHFLRELHAPLLESDRVGEFISRLFGAFELFKAEGSVDSLQYAIENPPQAVGPATRKTNAENRRMSIWQMCKDLSDAKWTRCFGFSRHNYSCLEGMLRCYLLPGKSATRTALSPRETLIRVRLG